MDEINPIFLINPLLRIYHTKIFGLDLETDYTIQHTRRLLIEIDRRLTTFDGYTRELIKKLGRD